MAHLKNLLDIEKADALQATPDRYTTVGNQRVYLPHARGVADPTVAAVEQRDKLEMEYQREIIETESNIHFVDAWLLGLTDREQWIIQRQMIDREPWSIVVYEYAREFGTDLTKDSLKAIKRKAIIKIRRITNFQSP